MTKAQVRLHLITSELFGVFRSFLKGTCYATVYCLGGRVPAEAHPSETETAAVCLYCTSKYAGIPSTLPSKGSAIFGYGTVNNIPWSAKHITQYNWHSLLLNHYITKEIFFMLAPDPSPAGPHRPLPMHTPPTHLDGSVAANCRQDGSALLRLENRQQLSSTFVR